MRVHLENRKGAVLVLVGVFMAAAVAVLAFGIELSQIYVQANQLQTGADAAAHAGALELYLRDSNHVADTAVAFGMRNKVLGHAAIFLQANVQCGTWDPNSSTFTVTATTARCGDSANAVQATGHDPRQYFFSALWNAASLQTTRSATAWVTSSIVAGSCVRPFSIPYWTLTKLLDPTNPDTTRNLTPYDILQLARLPRSSLTFKLKLGSPPTAPGNFAAVTIGASGAAQYRSNIWSCNPAVIGPGTVLQTETGNMKGPTIQGADSLCRPHYANGACGNGQGGIGIPIKAPLWITSSTLNGNTSVTVKIVGSFSLDSVTSKAEVIGHWIRATDPGQVGATRGTLTRILLVR